MQIRASTRDLSVEALLKFGTTPLYILWLHRKLGEQGLGVCNKVNWQGEKVLRMGFPIWIDAMISEGNSLVKLGTGEVLER